jgi:hypothetical protein
LNGVTVAQLVEVRADYNSVGDVEFIAYNNTKAPLFLSIDLADLKNTSFRETLPYVKMLDPGFNSLFVLERDLDSGDVPRFHYQIKYFRSNPVARVDLDFPYLIPLGPGEKITSFYVKNIDGFFGEKESGSWSATGFRTSSGQNVYAARSGVVVEIAGNQRDENTETSYNGWNNTITLLQPDGTLACYRNVVDKNKKLKTGQKIFAGQILGEIAPATKEMVFLIYHESLISQDLVFVIPLFVTGENKTEMIISEQEFKVQHPLNIVSREMNKKEQKKWVK